MRLRQSNSTIRGTAPPSPSASGPRWQITLPTHPEPASTRRKNKACWRMGLLPHLSLVPSRGREFIPSKRQNPPKKKPGYPKPGISFPALRPPGKAPGREGWERPPAPHVCAVRPGPALPTSRRHPGPASGPPVPSTWGAGTSHRPPPRPPGAAQPPRREVPYLVLGSPLLIRLHRSPVATTRPDLAAAAPSHASGS